MFLKIKNIHSVGKRPKYSIQMDETNLYKNNPNFIANDYISKNSKHACVHKDSKVLTNEGYIPIKKLKKPCRIAYIDGDKKLRLTKKYIVHKTGKKKLYKVTTASGKEIIVSEDHKLFKQNRVQETIDCTELKHIHIGDKILVV